LCVIAVGLVAIGRVVRTDGLAQKEERQAIQDELERSQNAEQVALEQLEQARLAEVASKQREQEQRERGVAALIEAETALKRESDARKKESVEHALAPPPLRRLMPSCTLTASCTPKRSLAGNEGRAERILDECPESQRGWEWHFLKRQCRLSSQPVWSGSAQKDLVHVAFFGKEWVLASDGAVAHMWETASAN